MSYTLLGQHLQSTADFARKWFAGQLGAKRFKCEEEVLDGLNLRPTWQADLTTGYRLCLNVQPGPFSPTLHQFVNESVRRTLPIKFWVAIGPDYPREPFAAELKQAREMGVGVVLFDKGGAAHLYHRAVPFSLFALARTSITAVPKARRELVSEAENTFLDGDPGQGCQAVCQELESVTRLFAESTYSSGHWTTPAGAAKLPLKFFRTDSWATMLQALETRGEVSSISAKASAYKRQLVLRTRSFTEWRNDVSHKPRSLKELVARDKRLRTMFEATRDLLVDWYGVAKPFRIVK